MVYRFRPGFQVRGDPQEVGQALEAIRTRRGGELWPAHIVAEARRPGSVLHPHFEWDDTEAARQYRLCQAGYLIRAVVVCCEPDERPFEPVRAFVSTSESDGKSAAFTHICEAMRREELRERVLSRARGELAAWRRRYARLREFAAVFDAIDAVANG